MFYLFSEQTNFSFGMQEKSCQNDMRKKNKQKGLDSIFFLQTNFVISNCERQMCFILDKLKQKLSEEMNDMDSDIPQLLMKQK